MVGPLINWTKGSIVLRANLHFEPLILPTCQSFSDLSLVVVIERDKGVTFALAIGPHEKH